ncbi:MAG: RNA 2',3'-cyclic phosphodiesterase [Bacillota bacterium]
MRSFLALPFSKCMQNQLFLLQKNLMDDSLYNIKWVAKNNFHLTLFFFKNLSVEEMEILNRGINSIASLLPKITIKTTRLGCFPSLNKPSVLWLGIEENQEIKDSYFVIKDFLIKQRIYVDEKDFHPHITLGRIKEVKNRNGFRNLLQQKLQDLPQLLEKIGEIHLYESRLNTGGPIYIVKNKYFLNSQ